MLRASYGRPLPYLREEKERWVLAYFPHFCEDVTEALLELTAALTHLEMLSPLPLSWQPVGLKTQYMQSLCGWPEGPRAKRPLRKSSLEP